MGACFVYAQCKSLYFTLDVNEKINKKKTNNNWASRNDTNFRNLLHTGLAEVSSGYERIVYMLLESQNLERSLSLSLFPLYHFEYIY